MSHLIITGDEDVAAVAADIASEGAAFMNERMRRTAVVHEACNGLTHSPATFAELMDIK